MVLERPTTPRRPGSPSASSASPSRAAKRPLSSPVSSSAAKRANSEDLMETQQQQAQLSDTEGSLGASRLKISSTPASPSSDDDDADPSPPSYDDAVARFSGPPGDTQYDIVRELKQGELEDGDSWYLVSRVWYRRWLTACTGAAETKHDDASVTVDEVGPIDNSNLVGSDGELRKPLVDGVDVELLPAAAHGVLKEWYGSIGPEFERCVVNGSVEFYPPTFHVYLLCPTDGATTSPVAVPTLEHAPTISLASSSPFSALSRFAADSFALGRPTRLWRLPEANASEAATEGPAYVLSDKLREAGVELLALADSITLDEALLTDPDTRVAVEQQRPDGTWLVDAEAILDAVSASAAAAESSTRATTPLPDDARDPVATTTASADKKQHKGLFGNGWHATLHKAKSNGNLAAPDASAANAKASGSGNGASLISSITGALTRSKTGHAKAGQRGLVGLSNLGNTCFMNSAIQCMSNTKELKDYFLSGAYKDELNPDNPLGMRGQVAEAFGQLIERMWHGTGTSVAPREFKQAVARFAPQFSGYGQQDSQELLAFLLDGTHEDLNRILKKPATSAPDWEGGGDKELVEMAKTCWEQYRSRNDSVIVDLFQGQYRSTVVCPDCDKVSITFDPFMYVTTNLPVTKKWNGTVYVVPRDPTKKVVQLELEVPKNGTLKTLKNCVGKILDMDPKSLVVTEEWHSKFFKEWPDDDAITEINTKNDRILIYETSGHVSQPRFRKNKQQPVVAPRGGGGEQGDAPIVLVVLHRKAAPKTSSSSKMTFGFSSSSSGGSDYFGSPFVLSLSRGEASTVQGITSALVRQYARVTANGAQLDSYLEQREEEGEEQGRGEEEQEREPAAAADSATRSAMEVDDATPLDETSGGSLDSSSSTAPPTASTSLPAPAPPSLERDPSSSTSPSRKMFSMSVSKNRRNGTSLPLDQAAFLADVEPLEHRTTFAAARQSATTSTTTTQVDEDYDMFSRSNDETQQQQQPDEGKERRPDEEDEGAAGPLVHTGDYLTVDWDASAFEHFFSAEASRWDETESVVDSAISERRRGVDGATRKPTITLDQCLTEFTKEERLGEDDMWYCSSCKDFKQATKKVEIWKAPDVLVFALKRFSSGRYSRDKVDDLVEFPLEGFDMEPFVEGDKVEARVAREHVDGTPNEQPPATISPPGESLLYDLYAVSNHFGGLGGGHYTAFCKNPDNGKWYDFDDSRVSPLGEGDPARRVVSSAAYLVFYRRRTARPIGGKKSIEAVQSAIQSRQPSLQPSPFGSTDNLLTTTTTTTVMPGSFASRRSDDANAQEDESENDDDDDEVRSIDCNAPPSPNSLTGGDEDGALQRQGGVDEIA